MHCFVQVKWNRRVFIANRFSFKIRGVTSPWLSIHGHLYRLSRVVKADLDGTIFAYDSEGRSKERFTENWLYSLVQYDLLYLNLQSKSYTLLDVEIVDHYNPQEWINEWMNE